MDTDLGLIKTGKEANTYLVERRLEDRTHLLVRKEFRSPEHRSFHNDAHYRLSRRTGSRRVDLAMAQGTRTGMLMRAEQWARSEHAALSRLWQAGASVPYPIGWHGAELTMEYLGSRLLAAPRLVDAARDPSLAIADLWPQCVDLLVTMVRCGIVHADLSAYNLLVWRRRLFAIDLPQASELRLDDGALDFLRRDVDNVCRFFQARGVDADGDVLFADLISYVPWAP